MGVCPGLNKGGVSYAGRGELIDSARQGKGRGEFPCLGLVTDTQRREVE